MRIVRILVFLLSLTIVAAVFAGTTGKITGIVTDQATGEPLPGVNVLVDGTYMGAATDLDGYYVILNVPPGGYTMKAMMVGYATSTVTDVRVMIDQTSTINFKLSEETLEISEAITVVAKRPVVELDVAASRANLAFEEIRSLPITNVSEVVALQAGIEGLSIRGSGSDEMAFVVDGMMQRDERDNTPYTAVSLTAVEEIQVQTGGFNAEYGQVRSGLVNVVTKEGSRNKYNFSMIGRYSPRAQKHFGLPINDPNSYYMRPYVDDAVCWSGTRNGAWDSKLQDQYPYFRGWNAVSEETIKGDDDPTNDLTPQAAQRLFLFQHRKDLQVQGPDYDVDLSFGGPVPLISKQLGGLRFQTSYKQVSEMYALPLSEDGTLYTNWQMKLTSDLGDGKKLMIDGMLGRLTGTTSSNTGLPGLFDATWEIFSTITGTYASYADAVIYNTDYFAPTQVDYTRLGVKFTNPVNDKLFYEINFNRFSSEYSTNPGAVRDNRPRYLFGNSYYVDEAPFGFEYRSINGVGGIMRMGAGMSDSRDSSFTASYTLRFDLTGQLNRYNNIKTGAEVVVTDSRVNYARFDAFLPSNNAQTKWEKTPVRAAIYLQDKLEFEGMIAQVGLRMDYSHAGGDWYVNYNPYDAAFSGKFSSGMDTLLEKEPAKHIINWSPRLAIAYPISVNSKLFFNYGHFYQLPTPENLYLVRRLGANNMVDRLANPNNPLPRTVAYELGFEQNLYDQFLVRTTGYYKDVSDQPRTVRYRNFDNSVDYYVSEPNSYEDIRGFEISVNKNRGNWVRGFVNYTYMVSTYGYFGYPSYTENPVEQRNYESTTQDHYQIKSPSRPYARASIDFFTPREYGPRVWNMKPLEDWRMNILASWKSGSYSSWLGGGAVPRDLWYNVQWKDYYNVNVRMIKNFHVGRVNVEAFVDIYNVLNIKRLSSYGFTSGNQDANKYYKSLHLPKDIQGYEQFSYTNIPGSDRFGDYRPTGVDFVPIIARRNYGELTAEELNDADLYYFANGTPNIHGTGYYRYNSESDLWEREDPGRVKRILDDKAYIDMPNIREFTFLDPRDIFWGIKISFEL